MCDVDPESANGHLLYFLVDCFIFAYMMRGRIARHCNQWKSYYIKKMNTQGDRDKLGKLLHRKTTTTST